MHTHSPVNHSSINHLFPSCLSLNAKLTVSHCSLSLDAKLTAVLLYKYVTAPLIDSFLRSRSSSDHEATAMMKAQFMSLWDGLDTDHHCQVHTHSHTHTHTYIWNVRLLLCFHKTGGLMISKCSVQILLICSVCLCHPSLSLPVSPVRWSSWEPLTVLRIWTLPSWGECPPGFTSTSLYAHTHSTHTHTHTHTHRDSHILSLTYSVYNTVYRWVNQLRFVFLQSLRQREQILHLILENESVRST